MLFIRAKRLYGEIDIINTTGVLDTCLSELIMLAKSELDDADLQTIKRRAKDCIDIGEEILQILAFEVPTVRKSASDEN